MPMIGVYAENSPAHLRAFESFIGRKADLNHVYLSDTSWSELVETARWQADRLWGTGGDHNLFYSVPLVVDGSTLEQVARGDHTQHFVAAARAIAQGTPGTDEIYIRPGWELNGNWFAWSAVGRPGTYIEAFREFVDAFRSVSDRFKFEWNVNESWSGLDPATAYPGDAYVDVIGMDFYYRTAYLGTDPAAAFNTLAYRERYSLSWLEEFAAAHGKPTGYSEWGSMTDRASPLFQLLAEWMDQHDVLYHMYWDSDVHQPGGRLSDGTDPTSGATFRRLFGAPSPVTVSTDTTAQATYEGSIAVGANVFTRRAVAFDAGGQGVSYNDSTASQDLGGFWGRDAGVDIVDDDRAIGWINNGEWVEYTVNIANAGTYALWYSTNALDAGRTVTASFIKDGTTYRTSSAVAVPDTNDLQFVNTQQTQVALQAGTQVIRLTFNGGDFDFRSWSLDQLSGVTTPPTEQPTTPTTPTTPPTQRPYSGTAVAVGNDPVAIQAWRFDTGGQGVAYSDSDTTDNGGSAGRDEGVDIVGENTAIGWTRAGEWVEYTINVAQAGRYELSYMASSGGSGGTIGASFWKSGSTVTAPTATIGNTGSYGTFRETSPVTVDLVAGEQIMRIAIGGGFDLRSIELDRVDGFAPNAELQLRTSQSGAWTDLANQTVRGNVWISLPSTNGVDDVEFYINRTPGTGVTPYRIEREAPYDILGGAAYDTRQLAEGLNKITTVLISTTGEKQTFVTDFFVDNIA